MAEYDPVELAHWALTHGIIMSSPNSISISNNGKISTSIHAPFTLGPHPYSMDAFHKSIGLSPLFNELIQSVSVDSEWLLQTLKTTAESDEFTGKLLQLYKTVLDEGISQPISLGINRSDYMLHEVDGDARNLLQVEINTIASSFGSLTTKITEMFQQLDLNNYENIPNNNALESLAYAIAMARDCYVEKTSVVDSIVVLVVQPGERNFADQRLLHFQLLKSHSIKCVRASLEELYIDGHLDETTKKFSYKGQEVSVVYYRAGYTPDDYLPSGQGSEWNARLSIERSIAIKCPNIAYHLVGTKKVQQALAGEGVLERFLDDSKKCELIRNTFAGLYSLDIEEIGEGKLEEVKELALHNPNNYVMKPQREGGGNNLYDNEMVTAVQSYSSKELSAYILMEKIFPPKHEATLIREGVPTNVSNIVVNDQLWNILTSLTTISLFTFQLQTTCLSELGIFGTCIYDSSKSKGDKGTILNTYAGYILRVKAATSNEGGVAAGYAVLSAPKLQ